MDRSKLVLGSDHVFLSSLHAPTGSSANTRQTSSRALPMRPSANSFEPPASVQNRSIADAMHQAWSCGQNKFGENYRTICAYSRLMLTKAGNGVHVGQRTPGVCAVRREPVRRPTTAAIRADEKA